MSDPFLWVKWLHIMGATLLFGTGLGTAFHLWMAHRSDDPAAIAVVTRSSVLADWLFTATAAVLQPATGALLIVLGGHDWTEPWLLAAYALYILVGACWLPVVWIQIELRRLAGTAVSQAQPLPPRYHRLMRVWFALGWPAFLAMLAIFLLMVFKPVWA